ncbi:hypothetical protein [Accumulibacter sp.]|uniref:hypothetical protein n=1 Tax=Accumulibacter sp. TaxID=2053492 RepID=UPI002B8A46CF|nr:hypothetical protein [Accumulibacter sp.]HRF06978.1 hypothetical protein [Accumulibacter sp.]
MSFEGFTVVRVPLPFTDRNTTKNRPALMLPDAAAFNTRAGLNRLAREDAIDRAAPAQRELLQEEESCIRV